MPTTDMTALGAPRRPATAALLGPAAAASSPLRSTSHQPAAARLCAGALCRPAGSPPGAGSGFGSFRKGSGRAGGGRRAACIPERSGNGGRRCHQSAAPRRASVLRRGPARPLKGAARSPSLLQRHSSVLPSGGFAFSERRGARPAYPRYRYVGSYGYRFRHKHQDHTTHSTVTAV